MNWETIRFEIKDGVALLTLNRPDRLNAFTDAMQEEIALALDRVEQDDAVRALVITGAGRGFCAGQDLSLRAGSEPLDAGAALEKYYNPRVKRLMALGKPTIAAVNGPAAGAGASLALSCDLVIAARSASFLQAFARLGLVPDAGSTYFLPRLVGMARAKALALLAEPLPAETAAEWGLIWKVVDDEKLMPEALALAGRLAQGPTLGFGLIKAALNASPENSLETQLALEAELQRKAGKSADFREGVLAFLEKRPPRFSGR